MALLLGKSGQHSVSLGTGRFRCVSSSPPGSIDIGRSVWQAGSTHTATSPVLLHLLHQRWRPRDPRRLWCIAWILLDVHGFQHGLLHSSANMARRHTQVDLIARHPAANAPTTYPRQPTSMTSAEHYGPIAPTTTTAPPT